VTTPFPDRDRAGGGRVATAQDLTAQDLAAARHAARCVPGLPCDAEGPVFREPWEAQAFAMAVALQRRGLFGWDEWAAALGEEIRAAQRAGDPNTGETYYRHWLAALERMIAHKGIADRATLARYHDAWERAADRTPHGAAIELTAEDFAAK
jgi:nitrile hydratase accessory protein